MSDIELNFQWSGHKVRIVGTPERPEWVAVDVCRALGIDRTSRVMRDLDEDEKGVAICHTLGGPQRLRTVNEPGLYALITLSRKPEARAFRRWVYHEVLPAIRRHGSFTIGVADAAAMLGQAGELVTELTAQNTKLLEGAKRIASHAGSVMALYRHMPRNDPRQLMLPMASRRELVEGCRAEV